jgi:hypothetical protein
VKPRQCRVCSKDLPEYERRVRCPACEKDHRQQKRAETRVLVDMSVAIEELRSAVRVLRSAGLELIAEGVEIAIFRLQHGEAGAAKSGD